MLNGRLALEDVADVEGFCAALLDEQLHRLGAHLRPHDREDALAYLVSEAWRLSVRYDASVGQSFSKYAHSTLTLRVTDWYRGRFGRSRWTFSNGKSFERRRPELASLDELRDEAGELGDGLVARTRDFEDGRDPALSRLLEELGSAGSRTQASGG